LAGTYLVDATLDLGRAGLVSATLPLRIVPVPLPLASQPAGPGEMLTLAQEPANWGVDRVGARTAWTVTHGSPTVVVALIDSGIDSTVPQLADCLWVNEDEIPGNGIDDDGNGYVDDVHGWDFRDGDASSLVGTSLHGHGTSVAAIIAARPGRYPVVGIAPGVKLMDLRFLDSANLFRASDWKLFARAVEYAVDNGADLINLSVFANSKPPSLFEQALAAAQARGVLVVGIAGNQGKGEVMYPARNEAVLAVSACGSDDALASFSNYGPEIAFCAPGQSVMTFTTGGRVISQSGTSFAAPHVTGALALLLSAGRGLTAAQALAVLEATAVDLGAAGRDDRFGHGLVDAWAAMREALRR
jgi:subtilisin family serine protease